MEILFGSYGNSRHFENKQTSTEFSKLIMIFRISIHMYNFDINYGSRLLGFILNL